MRFKKRKKATRFRGSHTHARGFKKKARGSGHRGGFGMSGSENQKKSLIMNLFGSEYFGKDKTLRKGFIPQKLKTINLKFIDENISSLIKQGIAKQTGKGYDLDLKGYKILGDGETKLKLNINADFASQSAVEKIKKSGGELKLKEKKAAVANDKTDKKEAAKENPKISNNMSKSKTAKVANL